MPANHCRSVACDQIERTIPRLDEEIEARCGADIPWIFDVEGEVGFRDREARIFRVCR